MTIDLHENRKLSNLLIYWRFYLRDVGRRGANAEATAKRAKKMKERMVNDLTGVCRVIELSSLVCKLHL